MNEFALAFEVAKEVVKLAQTPAVQMAVKEFAQIVQREVQYPDIQQAVRGVEQIVKDALPVIQTGPHLLHELLSSAFHVEPVTPDKIAKEVVQAVAEIIQKVAEKGSEILDAREIYKTGEESPLGILLRQDIHALHQHCQHFYRHVAGIIANHLHHQDVPDGTLPAPNVLPQGHSTAKTLG